MATATTTVRPWIGRAAAARLLDLSDPRAIDRLAARGLIRERQLPGVRERFALADVERLRAEHAATGDPGQHRPADERGG